MGERYPEGGEGSAGRATLRTVAKELAEMEFGPPNGDIYISAFAAAAHHLLIASPDERLRRLLAHTLEYRQKADIDPAAGKKEEPFNAQYAANLLLRSLQHTALFRRSYTILFDIAPTIKAYPLDFTEPEAWVEEIGEIFDNSTALNIFEGDLTRRRIQSNIADRYKGIKLAVSMYEPGRFDGPLDILDVGASLNLGLTKLMIDRPFGEVDVLYPPLHPGAVPDIIDDESSERINALIKGPFDIASGTGVDILPVYDPNTSEWIRSCSFYPGELLNPTKTEEFDRLILASAILDEEIARRPDIQRNVVNLNLPRLRHYKGDFSDRNSLRGLDEKAGTDKFHVVSFVTMMHQLSDRERTSMIDRAKSYLHPGGLIVIQDFMNLNPGSPNGLEFPAHWTEFMYKTVVIDPQRADLGPQIIVTWDYGRCREALLPGSG